MLVGVSNFTQGDVGFAIGISCGQSVSGGGFPLGLAFALYFWAGILV